MRRELVVRALGLYLPMVATIGLWLWRKPEKLEATGALLATAWNLPTLFALNVLAVHVGWWRFGSTGAVSFSFPIDLWLGWAALWGVFAALAFRRTPILAGMLVLGFLDLGLMPLCAPVIMLGKHWIYGEILGLLTCLCPALLLGRWTRDQLRVYARALLQFLCFSGSLILSVVAVLEATGRQIILEELRTLRADLLVQALFLICLPAISAVQEFATVGNGTPLPFDPPRKLVTSGIYSYIANPMQAVTTLLLLGAALLFRSAWFVPAALLSFAYSAGLAWWDEQADLKERFGEVYILYRQNVRDWRVRWRPYVGQTAILYLSEDCVKCSQMARFLQGLGPLGLQIKAAEDHPEHDLIRMTYESGDRMVISEGIVALARAFEHVNLAWALLGMAIRLPLVHSLVQAVADASGGGPMLVQRRSSAVCALPCDD
jgi:protein-S-isoprenylcysteine O-methyltransferase Ste14